MAKTPVVTGLRTRVANVPLRRALPVGGTDITHLMLVLIDVDTDAEVTGHAYLHTFVPSTAPPLRALLQAMGDTAKGRPLAPAALHEALLRQYGLWLGMEGLVLSALGGIDMACWDAFAKVQDLPLARLLGGDLMPLPVYCTSAAGIGDPELRRDEAAEIVAAGYAGMKIRLGHETIAQDLVSVRAVRNALPDRMALMVDYTQALTADEAIARGKALEGEGLTWLEDPIPYNDLAGHVRIARELTLPVMTGENFYGPSALATAVRAQACDLTMIDLQHIGGVTNWLRAATLADAAQVRVSSHLYPDISAHMLALTPTRHWLEHVDWADPILAQPGRVTNGSFIAGAQAGSGIAWHPDLARHLAPA